MDHQEMAKSMDTPEGQAIHYQHMIISRLEQIRDLDEQWWKLKTDDYISDNDTYYGRLSFNIDQIIAQLLTNIGV